MFDAFLFLLFALALAALPVSAAIFAARRLIQLHRAESIRNRFSV